ncbi:MAG: DNA-directed RNA polymerase subunit K [Candidatus Micrarchaeota archaeon]|nr:DNA-directed RNA polymerase subunit K [Candidatus Micrarchaeota archaeon]
MELTKYEFARIIGARSLQLARGAPPMLKIDEPLSFIAIAELEFKKGIIPLTVLREKGA